MVRTFFLIGSVLAGIAVAAGAFGAHGLKNFVSPEGLDTWNTAVRYQVYHAFALIGVAFTINTWPAQTKLFNTAGWLFLMGVILFSGSLYTLVLSGIKQLGAITPIRGIMFVIGWLFLIIGVWKE